jgi:hypothetical protein
MIPSIPSDLIGLVSASYELDCFQGHHAGKYPARSCFARFASATGVPRETPARRRRTEASAPRILRRSLGRRSGIARRRRFYAQYARARDP